MVFVLEHILEIVIQGIGVAVAGAEYLDMVAGRGSGNLAILCADLGGHTVEAVIALAPVFKAALDLEFQIVDYLPVEGRIGVEAGAQSLAVVVGNRSERTDVVTVGLCLIILETEGIHRNRGILHGVFQTAVTRIGTLVVEAVGACSVDLHAGVADAGIDRGGLAGLELGLEVEVVADIVTAHHDGFVAYMGIAQGPVDTLAAARNGKVGGESAAGAAKDSVNPVVASHSGVLVDIAESTEIGIVLG